MALVLHKPVRKILGICLTATAAKKGGPDMNNIIYIVGLVVIVLFVAGYLGLR
jgi:hypothetical protein